VLKLPPLSLYIHFPWCVKKCPYCDFNSHPIKNKIPAKEYIDALIRDLTSHLDALQDRKIISIFLGGGTPSAFSSTEMARLFEFLFKNIPLEDQVEITIEANPGTIEHGNFSEYKDMGINRVSLGVQSFQNEKLKSLGRIHDNAQVETAINNLTTAGFHNFNIDIMHGLPSQTVEDALYDLQKAIDFNPTHLSWYQLTLEPNTKFYAFPPTLPDEDTLYEIERQGKTLLDNSGFSQYEISAYSKSPETQAKHNLNYWLFGDYIGIGAGAHGKLTDIKNKTIMRIWKHRHPKQYLSQPKYIQGFETITEDEIPYEFMINALRLNQGITQDVFENRTGISIKNIAKPLAMARSKSLLLPSNVIQTTKLGKRYLNDLTTLFSPS
jgi:putative oxygen-independent coproporphyrinogen III oxidase